MTQLVLSLFPGIGMLDMAFEEGHVLRAWAAGLIDGEGCISLAKSHQSGRPNDIYYRVDLLVSNTDRALLTPLKVLFGGRISLARKAGGHRRASYQWKTTGSGHAADVLRAVQPWLIAKQRQADVALRACALIKRDGYRRPDWKLTELEALKNQMHALNKRGPR